MWEGVRAALAIPGGGGIRAEVGVQAHTARGAHRTATSVRFIHLAEVRGPCVEFALKLLRKCH
jgi:hypothetical protein